MGRISILMLFAIATITILIFGQSFRSKTEYKGKMFSKISAYNIFKGTPADLISESDFQTYELATESFTDYAEKKRFIKVPHGYKLMLLGDGLPDFPEGTILVKTFYYFNDKSDPNKGKRLVETRVLTKQNSKWNAGTYLWNKEQTDADLITKGSDLQIDWIDQTGTNRNISYHIPNNRECASCHNSDKLIMPIGFKIRNLNRDVIRYNNTVNQLLFFKKTAIIDTVNLSAFSKLPDWQNKSNSLEQRARAYLEVNCAHCHNEKGSCRFFNLRLGYEIPFLDSKIFNKRNLIVKKFSNGSMPRLGTTIIHKEGLDLIKQYIISLK